MYKVGYFIEYIFNEHKFTLNTECLKCFTDMITHLSFKLRLFNSYRSSVLETVKILQKTKEIA